MNGVSKKTKKLLKERQMYKEKSAKSVKYGIISAGAVYATAIGTKVLSATGMVMKDLFEKVLPVAYYNNYLEFITRTQQVSDSLIDFLPLLVAIPLFTASGVDINNMKKAVNTEIKLIDEKLENPCENVGLVFTEKEVSSRYKKPIYDIVYKMGMGNEEVKDEIDKEYFGCDINGDVIELGIIDNCVVELDKDYGF